MSMPLCPSPQAVHATHDARESLAHRENQHHGFDMKDPSASRETFCQVEWSWAKAEFLLGVFRCTFVRGEAQGKAWTRTCGMGRSWGEGSSFLISGPCRISDSVRGEKMWALTAVSLLSLLRAMSPPMSSARSSSLPQTALKMSSVACLGWRVNG